MVIDKIIGVEDNTYYHIEDSDTWYVDGSTINRQCGIDNLTDDYVLHEPRKIEFDGIEKIRVGRYCSYFITKDHELYVNGRNDYGKLGIGDSSLAFHAKVSIDNVFDVYNMQYRTIIQTLDNKFYICGIYNDDFSQMYEYPHEIDIEDLTTKYEILLPIRLPEGGWKVYNAPESLPENVIDVVSAYGRYYYLTSNGQVYANGHGHASLFGINITHDPVLDLIQIRELPIHNVKSIKAGRFHTLFLTEDGKLYSCGKNYKGQLGIGNKAEVSSDLTTEVTSNVIYIEAAPETSYYALKNGRIVYCGDGEIGKYESFLPKILEFFTFSTKISELTLPPKKKVDYSYQDIDHRIIITYEVQDYDKIIMSSYIDTPSINKLTKIEEDIMFHFTTSNMDETYKDLEVVSNIRIEDVKKYIRQHTNFYDIPKLKTKTIIKLTDGSVIEVDGAKTKEQCISIANNYVYKKYNTIYDKTPYYNEQEYNNLVDGNPIWKPTASQIHLLSELSKKVYNTY